MFSMSLWLWRFWWLNVARSDSCARWNTHIRKLTPASWFRSTITRAAGRSCWSLGTHIRVWIYDFACSRKTFELLMNPHSQFHNYLYAPDKDTWRNITLLWKFHTRASLSFRFHLHKLLIHYFSWKLNSKIFIIKWKILFWFLVIFFFGLIFLLNWDEKNL
jgi:hypothetical protein